MIHVGTTPQNRGIREISGDFVTLDNEPFYRISNYDAMPPFLMTITSSSDHWLFISSNGALTAGRRTCDSALFPYYTDDKIHDSAGITGSRSILLVTRDGSTSLWEPFSSRYEHLYQIRRSLYKNLYGNTILFEETNRDLGLTLRYSWQTGDRFGFVRNVTLINEHSSPATIRVLDGIENILPFGLNKVIQTQLSTLADGYKKNELCENTGLGLFTLNAMMVDRPEPSETLRATTVWSQGWERPSILLSSRQLDAFRSGETVTPETETRGTRGAYFVCGECSLDPGVQKQWRIIADVNQDHGGIAALNRLIPEKGVSSLVDEDVARGKDRLARIIANADGVQHTADLLSTARHVANVLFNVMRGGIFENDYSISSSQFAEHVRAFNASVADRHSLLLAGLPPKLTYRVLVEGMDHAHDPDLTRLTLEYLPLTFGRRHGDPSRPWNAFSIDIKNPDGSRRLSYQGNWRDIFQNWEALCHSFPSFVEGMICKFVNACTADGYNPYRITEKGVDWEVPDPLNPWAHIGYWGDHQIIYLLRLLEISQAYHPGQLRRLLTRDVFTYAHVPYRLRPYRDLLANPRETIDFDAALEEKIRKRAARVGADGKLLWTGGGEILRVNLAEKLLAPALAKFTNFIPEGGIWLNTQRPEWNDANNALVGNGVSMVTVYYLRRYLKFCRDLFETVEGEVALSAEIAGLLESIRGIFERHAGLLQSRFTDRTRKQVLDELGAAGSDYRGAFYEHGLSGNKLPVRAADLVAFIDMTLEWLDHTIRANRRDDHLYHSYNLMTVVNESELSVSNLYEMLEGQVAVLSSGVLSPPDSLHLLDALRNSSMYRPDLRTYLLYPDRKIPRFLEKNVIPSPACEKSRLIAALTKAGDKRLVEKDVNGVVHFNGDFHHAGDVRNSLRELAADPRFSPLVAGEAALIEEIFESIFNHRAFTGRSGTFFKYEGLGSVYWHMVSKLLLAVQEAYRAAWTGGADPAIVKQLADHYHAVRAGLGTHKSPEVYGAFPMDPYSHTPAHAGAQQPGMTGQVKEDVLARLGELGIAINDGFVSFEPFLLKDEEFLHEPAAFEYYESGGAAGSIALKPGELAFTYCQVPVVYSQGKEPSIRVVRSDGTIKSIAGRRLDEGTSRAIFERTGQVQRIEVAIADE